MTTLHNQTKNAISWDMSGKRFACEPWGPVDIPEGLVDIAKGYGLPLGPVPVAPEFRAQQRVTDEQETAKSDATRALKNEITLAKAEAVEAVREVERLNLKLQEVRTQYRELSSEHDSLKRDYASALADKKAAEDLLADTARQATDAEEKAIRAEARMNEALGSQKKAQAPAHPAKR